MIRTALAAAAVVGAGALATAAPALAATPQVQAHRGGSFVAGKATYAENTLPAFRAAARRGDVLEMDTRVAQDGVVVLHDAALDRTTACEGDAADMTLAAIAGCPSDVAGAPGSLLGWRRTAKTTPVPLLADVLALAKREKATVSIELNDFDAEGAAPGRVLDVVAAAGLTPKRVIVQSFFPPNLALARSRLPGVALAVLTLKAGEATAIATARDNGAKWVSPQWPVSRAFVKQAHAEGRKVVPYTLNRRRDIRTARRIGVDALITDDPVMARRALRRR